MWYWPSTDGARSIRRGSVRTGCGSRDHQAAGASFEPVRPSCNPWNRRDCTRHWDLRAERKLTLPESKTVLRTRSLINNLHMHPHIQFHFIPLNFIPWTKVKTTLSFTIASNLPSTISFAPNAWWIAREGHCFAQFLFGRVCDSQRTILHIDILSILSSGYTTQKTEPN